MEINKLQAGLIEVVKRNAQEASTASDTAERPLHGPEETAGITSDLSNKNLKDLTETLNLAAKSMNQRVSFSFNDKIDRVVMKVINTDSNEVVREIPPKEMVRVYEHIHELIGMFVDASG